MSLVRFELRQWLIVLLERIQYLFESGVPTLGQAQFLQEMLELDKKGSKKK